ncbi:hypothetical protein QBC35DRAFT_455315 [Podospora australis]|uniref:Uncharacterized protein n=1 Tax=Podospora australis TaxID=1536484 RepID=A0AAN6WQ74_9PEZI|nr:hypothetical protein QBC35DRAFT_455315 [Podospora australis]
MRHHNPLLFLALGAGAVYASPQLPTAAPAATNLNLPNSRPFIPQITPAPIPSLALAQLPAAALEARQQKQESVTSVSFYPQPQWPSMYGISPSETELVPGFPISSTLLPFQETLWAKTCSPLLTTLVSASPTYPAAVYSYLYSSAFLSGELQRQQDAIFSSMGAAITATPPSHEQLRSAACAIETEPVPAEPSAIFTETAVMSAWQSYTSAVYRWQGDRKIQEGGAVINWACRGMAGTQHGMTVWRKLMELAEVDLESENSVEEWRKACGKMYDTYSDEEVARDWEATGGVELEEGWIPTVTTGTETTAEVTNTADGVVASDGTATSTAGAGRVRETGVVNVVVAALAVAGGVVGAMA